MCAAAMSSRIDPGLTLEGSVRGDGELVVAGRLRGALVLQGTLVVEEGGVVEAEVEATNVVVAGTLSGSVTAHEEVRILPGGYVDARVRASRLAAADGAVFRGELQALNAAGPTSSPRERNVVAAPASPSRVSEAPAAAVSTPAPTPTAAPKKRAFAAPVAAVAVPVAKPAAPRAAPAGPPRMPTLPKGRTTFNGR